MCCNSFSYVLNLSSSVRVNTPREFLLAIPTVTAGEVKQLEKRLRESKEKKRKGMFREFVQGAWLELKRMIRVGPACLYGRRAATVE
jgi:hypothetical protein